MTAPSNSRSRPLATSASPSPSPSSPVNETLAKLAAGVDRSVPDTNSQYSEEYGLNPVDVMKTRLQIQAKAPMHERKYRGFSHGLGVLFREEGVPGLMRGITASMIRELSYSSIRLGMYDPVKATLVGPNVKASDIPLYMKILAGMISGGTGSVLANPTDLIKIRFQARLPHEPKKYAHFVDAIRQIVAADGIQGLYRGVTPTMLRAAVLTSSQLSSYDHTKHLMRKYEIMEDSPALHLFASAVAGLVTATTTSPVDVIKTRIMNAAPGVFTGPIDCLIKSVRTDGPQVLMRGWMPNYLRLGPHFILSLPLYEQLRLLFGAGYM